MTDRDKREHEGERAMFARYKNDGDRTYYSFTPSAAQLWVSLLICLGSLLGGVKAMMYLDLRPTVIEWVGDSFAATIAEHKNFATHEEVAAVADREARAERERLLLADAMREEFRYVRSRLDAISDRVGAKK